MLYSVAQATTGIAAAALASLNRAMQSQPTCNSQHVNPRLKQTDKHFVELKGGHTVYILRYLAEYAL